MLLAIQETSIVFIDDCPGRRIVFCTRAPPFVADVWLGRIDRWMSIGREADLRAYGRNCKHN